MIQNYLLYLLKNSYLVKIKTKRCLRTGEGLSTHRAVSMLVFSHLEALCQKSGCTRYPWQNYFIEIYIYKGTNISISLLFFFLQHEHNSYLCCLLISYRERKKLKYAYLQKHMFFQMPHLIAHICLERRKSN